MSSITRSLKWFMCLLVFLAVGCGQKMPDAATVDVTAPSNAAGDSSDPKKIIPINSEPKSFEGNWVLIVTDQGVDNYAWIVRFSQDDNGQFKGEVIDATNGSADPQISETKIENKTVTIIAKNLNVEMEFSGHFDGVAIRGSLSSGLQEFYLARMLSTDADNLDDYVTVGNPPAAKEFQAVLKGMTDQSGIGKLVNLAIENKNSPIAYEAMGRLMMIKQTFELSDEGLLMLIDTYLNCSTGWGARVLQRSELQCAQQLAANRRLPEEALKLLQSALEHDFADAEKLKQFSIPIREAAETEIALNKSQSESPETQAEAQTALEGLLKTQPFHPDILFSLATRAMATKRNEEAIEYLTDVVAMPMLENYVLAQRAGEPAGEATPREQLKQLWIEKNGDAKGMEEHVDQVHRSKMGLLMQQIRESSPPVSEGELGNHTTLVELFTGSACPPCVAADIAVSALSATYPRTQLVALRYHQHIPGPDGLVNQDSEDRFAFYDGGGTPTVAIDGVVLDSQRFPYAGPIQQAGAAFNIFRQFVEKGRKLSTPIELELESGIVDGQLSIRAKVTGMDAEQLPLLRLRLALAEEMVFSQMPNGIRRHEMLVREMPGGARGIAPKKGELSYSYAMPLADLQLHLNEYIQRFESGKKTSFPEAMKPPVVGPLYLVGWVQLQGEKSGDKIQKKVILQTAIVPVSGQTPMQDPAQTSPSATSSSVPDQPSAPALPE